jgi:LPS-assembly protein
VRPAAAYLREGAAWGAGVALAGALALAIGVASTPAASQPGGAPAALSPAPQSMLLEADQLVYDFDGERVTAIGGVRIYYGRYYLDAEQVTFDQRAGTLTASGGVRMVEPNGNVVTAERMTLTDDFRDGFIESLNVITIEQSRFSAQSGERRDGNLLIFRRGVYTACAACLEKPGKPPLWQIRAARIVHDQSTRTVYYRHARFELFGLPIAYLPFLSHPDPTVKRKTGFLMPSILHSDAIGFGVTTPFFWNLAPNYDVTFAPTYLTRQGVLMQGEWRHRVLTGAYSIRAAGILQQDKDVFVDDDGTPLSGFRDFRGSVRTTAEFALNSRWNVGWDLHATTDRTFNRDYKIEGATDRDLTSTVYLTGLSERSYFDARGYYFTVQREDTVEQLPDDGDPTTVDEYVHDDQDEQAIVHPVIDHNYVVERAVAGGELRFDSNLASVSRDESYLRHPDPPFAPYFAGVAGDSSRLSSRAQWRRVLVGPAGQLFTPIAYLQGDVAWVDANDPAAGLAAGEAIGRAMPAVALEYEWPFVATAGGVVQTFGPRRRSSPVPTR